MNDLIRRVWPKIFAVVAGDRCVRAQNGITALGLRHQNVWLNISLLIPVPFLAGNFSDDFINGLRQRCMLGMVVMFKHIH